MASTCDDGVGSGLAWPASAVVGSGLALEIPQWIPVPPAVVKQSKGVTHGADQYRRCLAFTPAVHRDDRGTYWNGSGPESCLNRSGTGQRLRRLTALDRPGFRGGCDLWEGWGSWNRGSHSPQSCGNGP